MTLEKVTPTPNQTLTIEIEPSYPLVRAMIQFFRDQNKPRQALELCRLGLNFFPGDEGLRLLKAMAHLDLDDPGRAWEEISEVLRPWYHQSILLEALSQHPRWNDRQIIAQWLGHLARLLFQGPEPCPGGGPGKASSSETQERTDAPPEAPVSSSEGRGQTAVGDSPVLAALSGWVSQLKGNKVGAL